MPGIVAMTPTYDTTTAAAGRSAPGCPSRLPCEFTLFRRFMRNRRGVAAVEFALILPFMLLLYIGTAELTYGLMVNRKMTLSARALSDLVAQTTTTSGITDAELTTIFTAASATMSPYSATPLRMSVSSIEFVPNSATPPVYTARTKWSAVYTVSGTQYGTARPCGASAISQVSNSTAPSNNTMPAGLYGAGTIIVADVSYLYTPPFSSGFLSWSSTETGINFKHTTYMRPRAQTEIAYDSASPPTGRTKCTYT